MVRKQAGDVQRSKGRTMRKNIPEWANDIYSESDISIINFIGWKAYWEYDFPTLDCLKSQVTAAYLGLTL